MKRCTLCKETKDLTDFHGKHARCKSCRSDERHREIYGSLLKSCPGCQTTKHWKLFVRGHEECRECEYTPRLRMTDEEKERARQTGIKPCSKCKVWKPLDDFQIQTGHFLNRRSHCKECMARKHKENPWQPKDPEAFRKHKAARMKAYLAKNPEKFKEYNKRYQAENPGRGPASVFRQRIQDLPNREQIQIDDTLSLAELVKRFNGLCHYCNTEVKYGPEFDWRKPDYATMDHVIPVQDPRTSHTWENVVLACRCCNSKKSDSDLQTWLTKNNI